MKQRIFADLEKACRPDAILSSNTSTIDISLIGKNTRAADRIVGAHFFSPAHVMPLLEIVRTKDTSKQARVAAVHAVHRTLHCLRLTPVLVYDCMVPICVSSAADLALLRHRFQHHGLLKCVSWITGNLAAFSPCLDPTLSKQ